MESKDNTPLVGGFLVALAIVALLGLGAFTLAGRGTGDSVQTQGPVTNNKTQQTSGPSNDSRNPDVEEQESSNQVNDNRTVSIIDYEFSPKTITVKKGTTVTWTNQDVEYHDITPSDSKPTSPKSRLLGRGESYSYTFEKVGAFEYFCSPHPFMTGSVIVTE